jgi:4-hydroxyproline epimerase
VSVSPPSRSSAQALVPRITILDSHTAGEPTRLVLGGAPTLKGETLLAQLSQLEREHPLFRTAVLGEPRGSAVLVGALLLPPLDPVSTAAVLFFNDVGFLGMCGHGTIGLIHSLAWLGSVEPGRHILETPVGTVEATLHHDGAVTVANVPAWRQSPDVTLTVPGIGLVAGDVAWGGNWFFLITTPPPLPLERAHVDELTRLSIAVRQALADAGIAGALGAAIDHIEWFAAPHDPSNHSRNFVLCPGSAYDRSPCGTGTSAKLAVLAARGLLQPGEAWRQEGILDTVFTASYQPGLATPSGLPAIFPSITGRAWVTGETTLLYEPSDPFAAGISPA